jgi:hypothetical protein
MKPKKKEHEQWCKYHRRKHIHDCNCGADEYNQACDDWEKHLPSEDEIFQIFRNTDYSETDYIYDGDLRGLAKATHKRISQ